MSASDPFGLNEPERTQLLRPQPGGIGLPPRASAGRAQEATGEPLPEGTPGQGPLVQAAHGLLVLAPRLATRDPPMDPARLRERLEGELRRYEDRAHAAGADARQVRAGHYALCALLDDVVLNTPWGAHGSWKSQTLAGTLHHDVAAGERFYDLLDQARREPERARPLLQLLNACLALGFEGKYRLGGGSLQAVRDDLAAMLARDGTAAELSPAWKGIEARHVALSERVPLWVMAAATALLLGAVYAGFALRLGGLAERLPAIVAALPPQAQVEIVRATTMAAVPVAALPVETVGPALRACLAPAGIPDSAVTEDAQKIRVRLPNAGMFRSGRADLAPAVEPLIGCIGGVLRGQPGRVLVVGHSDNVPIRTARFPSNWELSTARARAVEEVLATAIGGERIVVRGRADTEPVAPNDTEEGRSANRRVEIVVLR